MKNQEPQKIKRTSLLEESILPTWLNQRTIGWLSYFWLWVGMAVIIATFSLGATGVSGLSLPAVIATIFFANLTLAVVMALTADIGTEHGVSFAVYLRAPFGIFGTHFPSISRGIVAAIWFGIQTYLGALALNGIISYVTGYDNWWLWYIIFTLVQVLHTALGIRAIKWFSNIVAPAIIGVCIWMYYSLENLAATNGKNIWTFVGSGEASIFTLFVANMAFWSALAVDIPNITRFLKTERGTRNYFKRNKNIFMAQFVALPVIQAGVALIGAVSFIATGDWNPITVIQGQGGGFSMVILLILILTAQWSTNTAANLIPATLTFVNAGAPKVTYRIGLVIATLVATASMPWLILNNLFSYLNIYGAILSAVGGIMVCDYFVIRKRMLNVPDLYSYTGQFVYTRGINYAGIIAWILGGAFAIYFISYAYVVGFPIAFIAYYFLTKYWILKKYPQVEVDNPDPQKYLATSVGISWVYSEQMGMQRLNLEEISKKNIKREDL